MATIHRGRFAARLEGDFVVFLIGMRINQLLKVHKWLPVSLAMPRMLRELASRPEFGLLGTELMRGGRTVMTLQYWRSFEQLHAYAHARDTAHLPAWAAFNRAIGDNEAVGIFHETYLVKADQYEAIHVNMPRFGLGRAGRLTPAIGRMQSAKSRMQREETPGSNDTPTP